MAGRNGSVDPGRDLGRADDVRPHWRHASLEPVTSSAFSIRIGKTIIGAAGSWRGIGETARAVNAWWFLFLFRDDFAYVRFFAAIASP
jgi:hypothetical protein